MTSKITPTHTQTHVHLLVKLLCVSREHMCQTIQVCLEVESGFYVFGMAIFLFIICSIAKLQLCVGHGQQELHYPLCQVAVKRLCLIQYVIKSSSEAQLTY